VPTARQHYASAARALGDPVARSFVQIRLGFARYDEGDLEAARAEFEDILRRACSPILCARATGYLGNVARAAGDRPLATTLYDRAKRALETEGDDRFVATFAMDRAITALLDGNAGGALVELEALARSEFVTADPLLGGLVAHYRALARMLLGVPTEDLEPNGLPVSGYLARVRAALVSGSPRALQALQAEAPANGHARASLEIVVQSSSRKPEVARALVVSRHGTFFRLGDAPLVMVTQRGPLGRLLVALAQERLAKPGRVVPDGTLTERTWPGERLVPSAQKNRLHVAIATLRKLGLRGVLLRRGEGYFLANDVTTIIVG
jgi:hypothetical protein